MKAGGKQGVKKILSRKRKKQTKKTRKDDIHRKKKEREREKIREYKILIKLMNL